VRVTFSAINLTASIDSNKTVVDTVYKLPQKLKSAQHVYYVHCNLFVGDYSDRFYKLLNGKRGVFYYKPDTKKLKIISEYNLKINPNKVIPATNINARETTISPNRKRLATVLFYYPVLEVLDEGSLSKKRYLLDPNPPSSVFSLKAFKKRNLNLYYEYVSTTDKYIYLLYSGAKEKNQYSRPMRIQILDWNGHPVAQYLIPTQYKLSSISVNKNKHTIYGVSIMNDAVYKFKYKFPKP
jgi:hypothetical protein